MVFEQIIKEMANKVAATGFVSKSGGLLYQANTTAGNGDGVLLMAQVSPFNTGKMVDASPSLKETGISFFTAGPTAITAQDTYLSRRQNEVILTVWINGKKAKPSPGASVQELLVSQLRLFRPTIEEGSPIRMFDIEYLGDVSDGVGRDWGWLEEDLQYHLPPNQLFQLRFSLVYTVAAGCSNHSVVIANPSC